MKHLSGFIGLSDIEHIRVEGLSYGPETAEGAIANARTAMATPLAKAA